MSLLSFATSSVMMVYSLKTFSNRVASRPLGRPDSVPAIYKASTKFLPRTLRSYSDADSDAGDYANGATSDSHARI
jgi:hypothetical protein